MFFPRQSVSRRIDAQKNSSTYDTTITGLINSLVRLTFQTATPAAIWQVSVALEMCDTILI
jgi:hypothetical protein